MSAALACDIVIPVYNKPDLTLGCLKSIVANTSDPYGIILIDNGSDDITKRLLKDFEASHANVRLARSEENLGWVRGVNLGMAMSQAPYVCIMNNDTVVETGGWLSRMIAIAGSAADIGLVNPDFGDTRRTAPPAGAFIEIDFCRGYCVLIKRAVIDKIGRLDEVYGLGYYDDDDYSVRAIRAGFRCVKAGGVTVRHLRDSTFSTIFADEKRMSLHRKNKELFYRKWGRRLRLLFIVGRDVERDKVKRLLLATARRQHIVYLWNSSPGLGVQHINVREKSVWRYAPKAVFAFKIWLNMLRKRAKRYDAVFVEGAKGAGWIARLTRGRIPVYGMDIEKDEGRILTIIDAAAKV